MRKIILFNMITLDGYFSGPNGELDWHHVDGEFNAFAAKQLDAADVLLFGRVTYQMMASYWPTPDAVNDDPVIAGKMNSMKKIVFSKTLNAADWNNTKLVKENISEELTKMKKETGKDLFVFGSADLAETLIANGLIDEFRIMVNPVVLGKGRPLFKNPERRMELELLKVKEFSNGNVLLFYRPARKEK